MKGQTYPAWSSVNDVPSQYAWLDEDADCGVCVIGGGLTGALCALRLAENGEDVILLTAHQIGYGATSDAAPCVQYDFGQRLTDIRRRIGPENALRVLELGAQAIDSLEELSESLDGDFGFRRCDTLLYTNDEKESEIFNREYLMRRHNGFDCSFMSRAAARDIFSFEVAGGIFSPGLGARLDPYRLTQLCVKRAVSLGARVYENTKVEQLDSSGSSVVIDTSTRKTVFADSAVIAVGSGFEEILSLNAHVSTGFYTVSKKGSDFSGWTGKCIINTWAQPGITIAPAPDGRLFCGGLETGAFDAKGRFLGFLNLPALYGRKIDELQDSVRCHFPTMKIPGFEFERSVRYVEAFDRMPVIGAHIAHDKCLFACCTGPGAVLFSVLAAELISGMIDGTCTEEEAIFSPMRFMPKKARSK